MSIALAVSVSATLIVYWISVSTIFPKSLIISPKTKVKSRRQAFSSHRKIIARQWSTWHETYTMAVKPVSPGPWDSLTCSQEPVACWYTIITTIDELEGLINTCSRHQSVGFNGAICRIRDWVGSVGLSFWYSESKSIDCEQNNCEEEAHLDVWKVLWIGIWNV